MRRDETVIVYNMIRSLLFVPTLNEKFVATAHTREAHAIILDLEDSITLDKKAAARDALAKTVPQLRLHKIPLLVRVNNDAVFLEDDLQAAVVAGVDAIMIPKIDSAAMLQHADVLISTFERAAGREEGVIKILALVESPIGMFNLRATAQASPRLVGLGFGSEDYAAALGVEPTVEALAMPAQQLAMIARAFDLAALGIPGSIGNFNDTAGFQALVRQAKAYGFTGTPGIHPKQILAINAGFRSSEEELEQARKIVQAYEKAKQEGAGAVALDGKMIDLPIVERARRTLMTQAD